MAFDLRNKIYERLQRLSYAYHDRQQTGQIMSRATQDVEGTRTFIQWAVMRLLDIAVRVTVAATLMFITNWQLALVAWLLMPIVAWRSVTVQVRSRRCGSRSRSSSAARPRCSRRTSPGRASSKRSRVSRTRSEVQQGSERALRPELCPEPDPGEQQPLLPGDRHVVSGVRADSSAR